MMAKNAHKDSQIISRRVEASPRVVFLIWLEKSLVCWLFIDSLTREAITFCRIDYSTNYESTNKRILDSLDLFRYED